MPLAEAAGASVSPGDELTPAAETVPSPSPWRITRRRVLVAVLVLCLAGMGFAYGHRSQFTAQGADLSRRLIGDENTARIESWYFRLQDRIDKTKYRLFGGETNPFEERGIIVQFVPRPPARTVVVDLSKPIDPSLLQVPDFFRPKLMAPPETRLIMDEPVEGEGVWTTAGLPRSSPADMLMAKTFIRPDPSRPYALVGVLLLDSRRIRLHIVGGTEDPGGDRGVHGPGTIPESDLANLLVAWNGGFKGPHGGFGMVA
ncbi:MAG: hypothetical protein ACM3S1_16475, partial [Hyphomicrobiales bacterium]